MLHCLSLSLTYLVTLVSLSQIIASPIDIGDDYHYRDVSWRTDFRGRIYADSVIELEWTGGSGKWEVYYVPQWEGQAEYAPVDIAITTSPSIKWRAPKLDSYPSGTTFIMVINDAQRGIEGKWFDTTPLLDFVAS